MTEPTDQPAAKTGAKVFDWLCSLAVAVAAGYALWFWSCTGSGDRRIVWVILSQAVLAPVAIAQMVLACRELRKRWPLVIMNVLLPVSWIAGFARWAGW